MSVSTHTGPNGRVWANRSDRKGQPARVRLPDPIYGAREIVLIAANDELDDLERFILEFLEPAALPPSGGRAGLTPCDGEADREVVGEAGLEPAKA